MRFLSGLLFLYWLLPLSGERVALFSLDGWFDREAYLEASRLPGGPPAPMGWSVLQLPGTSRAAFEAMWWGGIAVLVLFTLGVATRLTSVLAWVMVVSCLANPVTAHDADFLLAILALYLMVGYLLLGQWDGGLTPWERLLGPRGTSVFAAVRGGQVAPSPSRAANLAVRLIQVHFAIVIVTSGFHKLQFGDWWAGVAYWYPLHPAFQMSPARLGAERATARVNLFFLSLATYLALAWQITFPLFAFRPRWRPVLLGGAAAALVGTIYIYREPILGPVYAVACLAYLRPEEWRRLTGLLARAARFVLSSRRSPAPAAKALVSVSV
jgi:hypothetical protein